MPVDDFAAKMQMPGNVFRADTAKQIGMLGLGSAGLFAALRGVRGLADTWHNTHGAPPMLPTRRQFISVPVPRQKDPQQKRASGPFAAAAAAMLAVKHADGPMDAGTTLAGRALDAVGGLKAPDGANWGALKDTWWNHGARSVTQMPWATWAAPLAIAGGGYLGHKAVDTALGAAKNRETDSELAEARKGYERALMPKHADAPPDPLDVAYDRMKAANALGPLNGALGGYALAATLLAGGAGVSAYNWHKSHSEGKTMDEALRQRRERMFAQGPAPIVAMPQEYDDPELSPPTPARFSVADLRGKLQHALPKAANVAQAADGALQRFEQNKQRLAQQTAAMLGALPDDKSAKPAAPAPPQLPSVAHSIAPGPSPAA